MNKNANSADVRYLTRIAGKSLIETGARLLKLYPNLSVLFGTTFLSSILIPKMRMKF